MTPVKGDTMKIRGGRPSGCCSLAAHINQLLLAVTSAFDKSGENEASVLVYTRELYFYSQL